MSDSGFPAIFGVCGLLIVALIAGVIVLIVFGVRREKQRRQRLAGWALANEWTLQLQPQNNWAPLLPGHNKRGVQLALTGYVNGRVVTVAEYQYTTTTSSGDGGTSTTTHHYVVVTMQLPRAYPPMSVTPRGGLSKLGRSLFGEGRAVTGNTVFDERFRISTRYPEAIPAVIGPYLIAAHLAGQVPVWTVSGDLLLYHFPGVIKDPASIPGWAALLPVVADLLGH